MERDKVKLIERMKKELQMMEENKIFYIFAKDFGNLDKNFRKNQTDENRRNCLNTAVKFKKQEARHYYYKKFVEVDEEEKRFFERLKVLITDIKKNGNINTTFEDIQKIINLNLEEDSCEE